MGARPEFFLLSIGFPAERGEDYPLAVARGALSRATPLGVALVGGDLSAAAGRSSRSRSGGRPAGQPLLRSGARAGRPPLSLRLPRTRRRGTAPRARARRRSRASPPASPTTSARELARRLSAIPSRASALGLALAKGALARAAIDVSDGLGLDAGRLARASGLRAVLEAERLPVVSRARRLRAGVEGRDPIELIALAAATTTSFSSPWRPSRPERSRPRARTASPLQRIGRLEEGRGAVLRRPRGDRDIAAPRLRPLRRRRRMKLFTSPRLPAPPASAEWRRRWRVLLLDWLGREEPPERVAAAIALGVGVGFSPFLGFHFLLALGARLPLPPEPDRRRARTVRRQPVDPPARLRRRLPARPRRSSATAPASVPRLNWDALSRATSTWILHPIETVRAVFGATASCRASRPFSSGRRCSSIAIGVRGLLR